MTLRRPFFGRRNFIGKNMILYYVRHGDPIYNPDSLTELGHKQAAALAKRFALYGLDEVYSSPSNRAILTAKPTCDALGLEIKICDWADEAKAGADTGFHDENGNFNWCFTDKGYVEKFNNPFVCALGMEWYKHEYFKGMPFEKGMKRIYAAVDEFLLSLGYQHDREKGCYHKIGKSPDKVALFAHGGAGVMILSSILNIPYPYFATHFAQLSTTGVVAIGFGTGVGGDEGDIYPQLFQYSNDSHLYKEDLMTGYNNVMKI